MIEIAFTAAICAIAILSIVRLALVLHALGGFPVSPRQRMNRAIDRHQQRNAGLPPQMWRSIPAPSPEQWVTLDQPLRIDAYDLFAPQHIAKLKEAVARIEQRGTSPEREPERWSDIRPSHSGPFTLRKQTNG